MEDIINLLAFRLKGHYEDETPKGWILNAIGKLSSCPKYVPGSGETDNMWVYFSRSKNWDIYQRSVEYKQLSKYKWGLRESSLISLDKSLSFLNSYVQKSLAAGAKPFDQNRGVKSALSGFAYLGVVEPALKTELNIKPYNARDANSKGAF